MAQVYECELLGVPNLYWGAVSLSALRREEPNFIGLLPDSETTTCCPHSFRYLRQQHQDNEGAPSKWTRLHAGCLTTGRLADLLGFNEKPSLKLLKVSRPPEHHKLVEAVAHLALPLDPLWLPVEDPDQEKVEASVEDPDQEKVEASVSSSPCSICGHPSAAASISLTTDQPSSFTMRNKVVNHSSSGAARQLDQLDNVKAEAIESARRRKECIAAARGGVQGVRLAYGSIAEGRALWTLLHHILPTASTLHECGMMVPRQAHPSLSPSLNVGASPDAMVCHRIRRCDLGESDRGDLVHNQMLRLLQEGKMKELALSLLSHLVLPRVDNVGGHGSKLSLDMIHQNIIAAFDRESPVSYDQKEETWIVREVVEIKSSSPFAQRSRGRKVWVVSDRGPREQISQHWIPQLQLQMHCSDCVSALLVNFSATKGVRIFRVVRNDNFLSSMLSLASRVRGDYCSPNVPPPGLYLGIGGEGDREQRNVLMRTVEMARRTPIVAVIDQLDIYTNDSFI